MNRLDRKAFGYSRVDNQVMQLLDVIDKDDSDYEFVLGLRDFGRRTRKITLKQLTVLGRIYKRHVNKGQYVHHDWDMWK